MKNETIKNSIYKIMIYLKKSYGQRLTKKSFIYLVKYWKKIWPERECLAEVSTLFYILYFLK